MLGQDCPSTHASPYSVKGERKAEMFSFHPLCFGPSLRPLALCSCLLSLGSHAWSPSVSADSRDERDGPGRVLGHWALSADGRPWQGCFHASTPSRQPSERLILSFLHVFSLFSSTPFAAFVLPFLTLQKPTFHCCSLCPLTKEYRPRKWRGLYK